MSQPKISEEKSLILTVLSIPIIIIGSGVLIATSCIITAGMSLLFVETVKTTFNFYVACGNQLSKNYSKLCAYIAKKYNK